MSKPIRTRIAATESTYLIETTDDGSHTLVRRDGDLAFHSGCGAASECDHVYISNGGFIGPATGWPQSVLEVGFGTGLAMLRTIDRVIAADRPLTYVGLEHIAVPVDVLRQLDLGRGLVNLSLADRFLRYWNQALCELEESRSVSKPIFSRWQVDASRRVTIVFGDAKTWLDAATDVFDTVYFDPFDPQSNPELWTEGVFCNLARCLRPQGRLVTYCVKGEVRQRLAAAGFEINRVAGPIDGKREVLIAVKLGPKEQRHDIQFSVPSLEFLEPTATPANEADFSANENLTRVIHEAGPT